MTRKRNDSVGTPGGGAGHPDHSDRSHGADAGEKGALAPPKRRKGIIGRWLDRLASANEKEFGPGGPCCH